MTRKVTGDLETLMDDTFLTGSPEECVEQIAAYHEMGFTDVACGCSTRRCPGRGAGTYRSGGPRGHPGAARPVVLRGLPAAAPGRKVWALSTLPTENAGPTSRRAGSGGQDTSPKGGQDANSDPINLYDYEERASWCCLTMIGTPSTPGLWTCSPPGATAPPLRN